MLQETRASVRFLIRALMEYNHFVQWLLLSATDLFLSLPTYTSSFFRPVAGKAVRRIGRLVFLAKCSLLRHQRGSWFLFASVTFSHIAKTLQDLYRTNYTGRQKQLDIWLK